VPGRPEEGRKVALVIMMRTVWGMAFLALSQTTIFGVSTLPAILLWSTVYKMEITVFDPYVKYVVVAMSLIPAYYLFCLSLMFLSAGWNRVVGWRTTPGEYSIHDANSKLVKWASYNASIQLVRVFAGEFMRTGPFWTWYLKANGAKIGKGVYVNSARLFDHNLISLHDKSVVGGDAKLIAHLVERGRVVATPVIVGKNAVIGVNAVVSPGVDIGENSAVGAMSFVPKHTKIPANEAWGGVPAKLIKKYDAEDFEEKRKPGVPVAA
jgi:acetyltransferase-like isoleucine patch superfamily enzyme